MKLFSTILLGSACLFAVSSCSDGSRLASKMSGSWSGAPEQFAISDASSATMTPVYTFEENKDIKNGGDLTMTSMLSAIVPVSVPSDSLLLPIQVTVSAVGTVNGTWKIAGDDNVVLSFDYNTVNVVINPENVTTTENVLTGQTMSYWQQNRSNIAAQLQAQIANSLKTRLMAIRSFDDVEIKNDMLEYEFGDIKMYLHRDNTIQ